jgi:hypothetical protein
MAGAMHTGIDLRKLSHARGMPDVRGHDARRKAISDPEEEGVSVLPPAHRHAAMSLTPTAGLPYQRMHADASQDVAQHFLDRSVSLPGCSH